MTISDLLPKWPLRMNVVWLSANAPLAARAAFEDRDFKVDRFSEKDLKDEQKLSALAAVVLAQSDTAPERLEKQLEKFALTLLDCGCLIIIRPSKAESTAGLSNIIRVAKKLNIPTTGLPGLDKDLPPHAAVYDIGTSWKNIANDVFRYLPGPPPEDIVPQIDPPARGVPKSNLSKAELRVRRRSVNILLRRAFWQCSNAHLVQLSGGFSGAQVFCAYLEFPGAATLPYFVKVDKRRKIHKEYDNYLHKVDPFIPFHLGPQLVADRCFLGMKYGVIVGDFVEGSETLKQGACEGRAMSPIACLFDRTLNGWYRNAGKLDTTIPNILGFPQKPNAARFARAQALGATKRMYDLRVLYQACKSSPVIAGDIHGDLHASNICVRANDAIVIDFHSQQRAPLAYDAACLEASLLVDGFHYLKLKGINAWLNAISPMYESPSLDNIPPSPRPKDRFAWFQASVRQIRIYAREMSHASDQYFAALAVALLRKAYYQPDALEPEASRRAVAYVLAEKILTTTFGSGPAAAPGSVGLPGPAPQPAFPVGGSAPAGTPPQQQPAP